MDARSIGLVRPVESVQLAQLVLFQIDQRLEAGITVEYSLANRGILHIEGRLNGAVVPRIYQVEDFSEEFVFHIENARIVPDLDPKFCGIGRYKNGIPSLALNIDEDAVYISASIGQNYLPINLFTGKRVQGTLRNTLHTRSWMIEVPCGDVDYEPYLAFTQDI